MHSKDFFSFPLALAGPGGASGNLIDVEEGSGGAGGAGQLAPGQSKTQMLLEEEYNIEQLQERERSIRQLEVRVPFTF